MTDNSEDVIEVNPAPVEVAAPVDEAPQKPTKVAIVGKTITFVNFFLSLVFLATAFFFYSNRLNLQEKKNELLSVTKTLKDLEMERRKVVADYDLLIQNENTVLTKETNISDQQIKELEEQRTSIQNQIATYKEDQAKLTAAIQEIERQQEELITDIAGGEKDGKPVVGLREQCEDESGEGDALSLDETLLLDRIAKVEIALRQAKDRNVQLEETISEAQRAAEGG